MTTDSKILTTINTKRWYEPTFIFNRRQSRYAMLQEKRKLLSKLRKCNIEFIKYHEQYCKYTNSEVGLESIPEISGSIREENKLLDNLIEKEKKAEADLVKILAEIKEEAVRKFYKDAIASIPDDKNLVIITAKGHSFKEENLKEFHENVKKMFYDPHTHDAHAIIDCFVPMKIALTRLCRIDYISKFPFGGNILEAEIEYY